MLSPLSADHLCTLRGQVNLQYPDALSTMQITGEMMNQWQSSRDRFCKGSLKDIRRQMMQLLGIAQFNDQIEIIPTGTSHGRGYEELRFQVNCEGQMPVACVVLVPETAGKASAVEIHLHENGKAWYLNDLMRRYEIRPGALAAASGCSESTVERYRAGNYGYGHAKLALFDAYMDFFAPMRKRREELLADPGYVDAVLKRGAERASELAHATMDEVRKAVGLR